MLKQAPFTARLSSLLTESDGAGFARSRSVVLFTLAVLACYLLTPTFDYYWDGITFSLQIERVAQGARPALLFHQNHLLYNAAGYLLLAALRAVDSAARALPLMQVANSVIGAVSVGVFYRIVEVIARSRYVALVSAIALAFSAIWWKLATDVNAYMLSLLLILLCARNLLGAKPRWYLAGMALTGAMLIHELAALFYPAAMVAVFTNPEARDKKRFALWASLLAWGTTVAVYYLCAFSARGITWPLSVISWALSNQSGVSPSLNPLPGILIVPRANIDLFLGHRFSIFLRTAGGLEIAAAALALLTLSAFLFVLARQVSLPLVFKSLGKGAQDAQGQFTRVVPMALAWLCAYSVFLIFWEPWIIYYRVFYAPPCILLAAVLLRRYHSFAARSAGGDLPGKAPSGAALLAVLAMALFNLAFYTAPGMRVEANAIAAMAREANNLWDNNTIIYYARPNSADTAFEYFNEKADWRRLPQSDAEGLSREIDDLHKNGKSVWLNKGAYSYAGRDWLAGYAHGREVKLELEHAPAHYIELLPKLYSLNSLRGRL